MTDDYKEQLLNYVTGSINETSPVIEEIFEEVIETNRNKWTQYLPNGWQAFHFEDIIQDKNSDILILYGGYRAYNSTGINNEVYGIIILLDSDFNPIKTFFEYDNGTKLRYIQNMRQDEDNTFYMVDDTNYAYSYDSTTINSIKRIVLLNNFCSKINEQFSLVLRTSYIVPSTYNGFKCVNLEKNPNSAQYILIVRPYSTYSNNWQGIATIEFVINYGSSPTWTWTDIVKEISSTDYKSCSYVTSLILFNEDNYSIKLVGFYIQRINQVLSYSLKYYFKDFTSTTYSTVNILDVDANNLISPETDKLEKQGVFINEDECYFVLQNLYFPALFQPTNLRIVLYKYKISTNSISTIYENSYGQVDQGTSAKYQEFLFLSTNQGKLYIEKIINNQNNTANYYIQRYENTWNPILVGENKPFSNFIRSLYVSNKYNLLKIFLYPVNPSQSVWYFPIIKEIYNPTQYNGESYIDTNSLVPLYSNLYSNGSLVFSRNLYNISEQDNTTVASIEIPNLYLNNIDITNNELISKTKLPLIQNNNIFTKNIYETVFLNYINQINVIDEDTTTNYPNIANYINANINTGTQTNYNNTQCTKYRINYSDNTTVINPISWLPINKFNKVTNISIYANKEIESIDLLSNDETTVYLNIPVEVEIGNTYTIRQKVRTGDKPTPIQLQYNNENINYNNEPVMVYTEEV